MATLDLSEETTLPSDRYAGALAARVFRPDVDGPSVAAVREDGVFDLSAVFPTMRDLCEAPSPAEALRAAKGPRIGALKDILALTPRDKRLPSSPRLLAPVDLQAIKAAGVTFAQSLLERVIEEHAANVEQRERCDEDEEPAVRRCRTRQRHAGKHVGPDRRQIGYAPELQRDGQFHTANSSLTQFNSRAIACSMPPARRCSGSAFQV